MNMNTNNILNVLSNEFINIFKNINNEKIKRLPFKNVKINILI